MYVLDSGQIFGVVRDVDLAGAQVGIKQKRYWTRRRSGDIPLGFACSYGGGLGPKGEVRISFRTYEKSDQIGKQKEIVVSQSSSIAVETSLDSGRAVSA